MADRSRPPRLRLGIDLDGVVADFNAGWISRLLKDFGTAGLGLIIIVIGTIAVDTVSGAVRRRIVSGPTGGPATPAVAPSVITATSATS